MYTIDFFHPNVMLDIRVTILFMVVMLSLKHSIVQLQLIP